MNTKKLFCAILAVMVLCAMTACRSGGGETTGPASEVPGVTLPDNEGVVEWPSSTTKPSMETTEPVETTEPLEETTEPVETTEPEETTEPDEDPTDPVEEPTEPDEEPVAPTEEPTDDDPPATKPTEPSQPTQPTEPQAGTQEPAALTYEEYMALSPAEQQAYYESFPTLEEFIAWHNTALAEYEAGQEVPVVTGPIDIGDYTNP